MDHKAPGSVVAVTGAAGYLGSVLLERMRDEMEIEKIVAIDTAPARACTSSCAFHQMDIRDASLAALLKQERVTTLVHLAFVVTPIRDQNKLYDININGTRNVIAAAAGAGVRKIIFCSSTSVYGFHPDNPQALPESRPMQPNASNPYAVHKSLAESLFCELLQQRPGMVLTILRPCMILGPHMDNAGCRTARELWRIPVPARCNPTLQFVHEDDVVAILSRVIREDVPGTFNVVGRGSLDLNEFCRMFNKQPLRIWFPMLRVLHWLCWNARVPGLAFGPDWIDILRHSCIASGEKLQREHAFIASRSSAETLRSYLGAHTA
jgi:UDP-glucose 4-epimerase